MNHWEHNEKVRIVCDDCGRDLEGEEISAFLKAGISAFQKAGMAAFQKAGMEDRFGVSS